MNKKPFHLRNEQIRANVINFIRELPTSEDAPLVVVIQERNRTLDQNARLWATLNDIAEQVVWHDLKLSSEDWKHLFTASLKGQRSAPGIGGGFVVLGQSTSKMKVSEMRDLIELINAFGAEHNVKFSEDAKRAIEWANRWGEQQMRRAS